MKLGLVAKDFFFGTILIIQFLIGNVVNIFLILLTLMAFEFLSTTLSEFVNSRIKLRSLFIRFFKKCITVIIVSIAHFTDVLLETEDTVRNVTITFYLFYETMNILKRAEELGIPVPQVLIDLINIVKNRLRR
ncbi:phage holin family protein [Metabacillus arenae]|uniref:Phage holin family protein n=1 Tax=Metabacillus arenae TaxID=2771434 RepID=A0A926NGR2_9BACI|nr:phage holin family protein [Metabacillus arenae]MBD1380233.1 phage holin family protein [Metabacillus arenae]